MATNPDQLRLVSMILIAGGALCIAGGALLFATGRGLPLGAILLGIGVVDITIAIAMRGVAARNGRDRA